MTEHPIQIAAKALDLKVFTTCSSNKRTWLAFIGAGKRDCLTHSAFITKIHKTEEEALDTLKEIVRDLILEAGS